MTVKPHEASVQVKFAPESICYGCGPANAQGLHIESHEEGDKMVANWPATGDTPDQKFQAFPGMLYGGLIGCLLDCHLNWTAANHLMKQNKMDTPPCTVTANYTVKFLKPTPSDAPVRLVSWVVESKEDRATIEGELWSGDVKCATGSGLFVAVKPGHPAFHRW